MAEARGLINKGYSASKYRDVHANSAFRVRPPATSMLTKDHTLLPPNKVDAQGGQSKGKSPRKREICISEELNSPSIRYMPVLAPAGTGSSDAVESLRLVATGGGSEGGAGAGSFPASQGRSQ